MMKFALVLLSILTIISPFSSNAEGNAVKVGVSVPLSGGLAEVGEEIRRGMELARADYMKSSPKLPIELIFEDNGYQAVQAAKIAQKFISQDHVDVMVNLWDMSDVAAPLCERTKTPQVSLRWDPDIAEKFHYTFTFEATYHSYVRSQIALLKKLGVKSIAIVSQESKGWLLGSEELTTLAKAAGIAVNTSFSFVPESIDAGSIIGKAIASKSDLIVLNTFPPNSELLVKKIRELSPNQRFTGYFESFDLPALIDGVPFVSMNCVADWFAARYQDKFKDTVKSRAAHAYDLFNLIGATYNTSETKLSSDQFVAALSSSQSILGATGQITLAPSKKTFENSAVWMMVHNGKPIKFEPQIDGK